MRFSHKLDPKPWLEDKSCLTQHRHGVAPNPLCTIEFICATKKPIDFKNIKRIASNAVGEIANKIVTAEQESDNGTLILPWEYDFGTTDTETLCDDLKKLVFIGLKDYDPIRVQVWLDETRKYSIWDDGLD